ncbi:hypothetical protein F4553_003961 [Allocatelliglobosispora scoriae]|uniref:Uncharacterized protein n=1 Tax=Allocatelliglobosispora scoriae TaxID=643052 RepID=A0A841BV07_9ACTN|nr:hypothetical protein [Allocatelliglobosispora scoriae]MBB5870582.1 hypothetical protein [Allocatelliglobosispora scoriae]
MTSAVELLYTAYLLAQQPRTESAAATMGAFHDTAIERIAVALVMHRDQAAFTYTRDNPESDTRPVPAHEGWHVGRSAA